MKLAKTSEKAASKFVLNPTFTWERHGGYEVSTIGDARFSAFHAVLSDGRTIEEHYQCDVKGYDVGGKNWRLGKGKPPLKKVTRNKLWLAYLSLWDQWAKKNELLMKELKRKALAVGGLLSDRFATTSINQAHALVHILNRDYTDR